MSKSLNDTQFSGLWFQAIVQAEANTSESILNIVEVSERCLELELNTFSDTQGSHTVVRTSKIEISASIEESFIYLAEEAIPGIFTFSSNEHKEISSSDALTEAVRSRFQVYGRRLGNHFEASGSRERQFRALTQGFETPLLEKHNRMEHFQISDVEFTFQGNEFVALPSVQSPIFVQRSLLEASIGYDILKVQSLGDLEQESHYFLGLLGLSPTDSLAYFAFEGEIVFVNLRGGPGHCAAILLKETIPQFVENFRDQFKGSHLLSIEVHKVEDAVRNLIELTEGSFSLSSPAFSMMLSDINEEQLQIFRSRINISTELADAWDSSTLSHISLESNSLSVEDFNKSSNRGIPIALEINRVISNERECWELRYLLDGVPRKDYFEVTENRLIDVLMVLYPKSELVIVSGQDEGHLISSKIPTHAYYDGQLFEDSILVNLSEVEDLSQLEW